jgi:4-aminobutyrate aminotransferase-like enzyme
MCIHVNPSHAIIASLHFPFLSIILFLQVAFTSGGSDANDTAVKIAW